MEETEIKNRIKQIIFETTNVKVENIGDEALFVEDLDFDSLTLMEIAVNVDQEYDLDLPEEKFEELIHVNACVAMVLSYKKQGTAGR